MNSTIIEKWVNEYTDEMYSWAVFKVSDTELAKDLVQDTFLAATEKITSFKEKSTPKTWLFSILRFKIVDHYRAKIRNPINTEGNSLSTFFDSNGEWRPEKRPREWNLENSSLLNDNEFRDILKMCLDILPEKWNTCVKLKYILGMKGNEICEEMNISKNNYWQMIHRAKMNLRECLESKWFNN